jgi:hypothetical protein
MACPGPAEAYEATNKIARSDDVLARGFLRSLGSEVTTAPEQLVAARVPKATGIDAKPFSGLFLTADGYRAPGLEHAMPQGAAFVEGMKGRPLNDPEPPHWDHGLAGQVHALLIVGVSSECEQRALETEYQRRFADTFGAVQVLASEPGTALFNKAGDGIEHFGYVDGRSQPLALQEDVDREVELGGIGQWNPAITLSQLLVKCPRGEREVSCGSYFVFRKLEQDVQGFKRREIDLAEMLQVWTTVPAPAWLGASRMARRSRSVQKPSQKAQRAMQACRITSTIETTMRGSSAPLPAISGRRIRAAIRMTRRPTSWEGAASRTAPVMTIRTTGAWTTSPGAALACCSWLARAASKTSSSSRSGFGPT